MLTYWQYGTQQNAYEVHGVTTIPFQWEKGKHYIIDINNIVFIYTFWATPYQHCIFLFYA